MSNSQENLDGLTWVGNACIAGLFVTSILGAVTLAYTAATLMALITTGLTRTENMTVLEAFASSQYAYHSGVGAFVLVVIAGAWVLYAYFEDYFWLQTAALLAYFLWTMRIAAEAQSAR